MTRAMPRFLPVLTSFAGRVAGRGREELLGSGAVLARALSDTQKIVGHDGVLCLFEPSLLLDACLADPAGACLRPSDEVAAAPALQVLVDAVRALTERPSSNISVFLALTGPSLLQAQLSARCPGAPELADHDYVSDVFTAVLRAALESPAHGVALIESFGTEVADELRAMHRSARKLADFYERLLVQFLLPGSARFEQPGGPHCTFALPAGGNPCSIVHAISFDSSRAMEAPATTAGDVPAETPVAVVRGLCTEAMQSRAAAPGVATH
jgi:hypothetical protein